MTKTNIFSLIFKRVIILNKYLVSFLIKKKQCDIINHKMPILV